LIKLENIYNFFIMPIFSYRARNSSGEIESGWIDATNKDGAADILSGRGFVVIKIRKKRDIGFFENIRNSIFKRVGTRYVVLFMHQMSELIASGISISKSLRILGGQTRNKYLRNIINSIADDVDSGNKLSDACGRHRMVFTDFFVKMIKSGETSGRLEDVFMYLAEQQENNYLLTKKMRSVMIYPFFMLFTLFGIGIVMIISVVPRITHMFGGIEKELPFSTKLLMWMTGVLVSYWWLVILAVIFFVYLLKIYRGNYFGERIINRLVFKAPILGGLLKKFYLVRFSRSFRTLIMGGVDIVTSLKASSEVVGNVLYKDLLEDAIDGVNNGRTISSVFLSSDLVPQMYSQMIYVGERTGRLTSVLNRLTNFYTGEIEDAIKGSISFLEPALIVLIGVIASFLASAIIMPMYDLSVGL